MICQLKSIFVDQLSPLKLTMIRLAQDFPGIGGTLKLTPTDFIVEEIPIYEPNGEGEHLFLWIEKEGLAGPELTNHIARVLDIKSQDIGMAGLKDKHAITRQYVSIPNKYADKVPQLETKQVRVLSATRHVNKLRTGHLKGNRFEIIIRDVHPQAMEMVPPIQALITQYGFPNYYGSQRFGVEDNFSKGISLLTTGRLPGRVQKQQVPFLMKMALSAVQSELFNRCLTQLLMSPNWNKLRVGEVVQKTDSGGMFQVEDPEVEQPRYDRHEIVPTGPIWGVNTKPAQGDPGIMERQVFDDSGITMEMFANFPKLLQGTRRPYFVYPEYLSLEPGEDHSLKLSVTLPSGSYVTVLAQEFCGTSESDF
jgi:tRNA pseudouridine13 synthase